MISRQRQDKTIQLGTQQCGTIREEENTSAITNAQHLTQDMRSGPVALTDRLVKQVQKNTVSRTNVTVYKRDENTVEGPSWNNLQKNFTGNN